MTYRIPLYNWLDYMYKNYINLVSYANSDKIKKVTFELEVQKALPAIVNYITANPSASNKEISTTLGISEDIIESVMNKPISNLRKNKDNDSKIKSLQNKLKELKKFDPVKFTEGIINEL